ncbi:hypothetical protein ACGF7U_16965 [Micromonospora sp. NPDC047670]|uniref:hypothetical protein n=1 Tax=Micromonospora sp. NPDC047670 TaxID=3364252 RepID=UPI00371C79F9
MLGDEQHSPHGLEHIDKPQPRLTRQVAELREQLGAAQGAPVTAVPDVPVDPLPFVQPLADRHEVIRQQDVRTVGAGTRFGVV